MLGDHAPTTSRLIVGILLAAVSSPFVILMLLGVLRGEFHGPADLAIGVGLPALLLGVTLHFFIGTRIPWLLPCMFIFLGLGTSIMAVLARDWELTLGGLIFLGIGYEILRTRDRPQNPRGTPPPLGDTENKGNSD
ncbi:MAG: hypothetical protein JWO04_3075 [Gammaproteobacteria bacterium]|nr:hypothetical protein [Gammaproteobacteria bacterium]